MVTEIVRAAAPRLTLPASVTPAPAPRPPKAKSPLTFTRLAMVRTVPSLRSEVPAPIWSTPRPTGPLVTAPLTGVELAPSMRAPAARVKSEAKVLWPLRARRPAPDLVSESIAAFWVIGALMVRPVAARPALTVRTGLALLNCREVPLMTGTETVDWLEAVTALVSERIRDVPTASVGLDIAPSLSKVTVRNVFVPTSVRLPPPRRLTLAVEAIWPSFVCMTTEVLVPDAMPVTTRSPGTRT